MAATGHMTTAEREAFLADLHVGILSVTEPGRGPLALPVWYVIDGTDVVVSMDDTSKKHRLLAAAGRATLTVQDEAPPYKYVTVEGPVRFERPTRDPLQIPVRYLGDEFGAMYAEANPVTEHSVEMRLTPEHWNTFDFAKLLGG